MYAAIEAGALEFENIVDEMVNGRPRASITAIATFVLALVGLITLGVLSITAVVQITGTIGDIKGDVRVLQQQMLDVRTDVREVVGAVRKAERQNTP